MLRSFPSLRWGIVHSETTQTEDQCNMRREREMACSPAWVWLGSKLRLCDRNPVMNWNWIRCYKVRRQRFWKKFCQELRFCKERRRRSSPA
jgi:hypothetical protein